MSLFRELKRRNVYRVAALYVIVSWLILQVVDVFTSFMPLPAWTGSLVFLLLLIGFPLALVFAWAYEMTPDGLKRERSEAERSGTSSEGSRRTSDYLIYLILAAILGYLVWQHDWDQNGAGEDHAEIRSLVVLPFENLMDDPDQAYFVAGMHDTLIGELSKINALHVISRTSAMRYRDSQMSIPDIARELGVDAVVEGSVLKADDTVRIKVQLIEGDNDTLLWTESYDRRMSDILNLYLDVTREIARQVQVTLTPRERAQMHGGSSVDPEVYELFLKGRYLCDNWSPEEMRQGVRLLEDSIRRDPTYAPAHARLALCLQYAAFFNYVRPLDILERSRRAAQTAMDLDPTLADALVAWAGIKYYLELEPRTALEALERALSLEPSNLRALIHTSWLLGEAGQFAKAYELNRRAIDIDPMSTVAVHAMAQLYYLARDFENAIQQTKKALVLDMSDPSMHYFLALPYDQMGRYELAQESYREAVALSDGEPLYRAGLAYSMAQAGRGEEAKGILAELQANERAAPFDIGLIYLGLGDNQKALDWLEKSYESRDSQIIYLNRDARFDPLRVEPRFKRILEAIDYPPADEPLQEPGR